MSAETHILSFVLSEYLDVFIALNFLLFIIIVFLTVGYMPLSFTLCHQILRRSPSFLCSVWARRLWNRSLAWTHAVFTSMNIPLDILWNVLLNILFGKQLCFLICSRMSFIQVFGIDHCSIFKTLSWFQSELKHIIDNSDIHIIANTNHHL